MLLNYKRAGLLQQKAAYFRLEKQRRPATIREELVT